MMIAFQGEPGSYSDKAARELLGPSIITLPKQSFEEVFNAVYFGEADYCVVPIENSLGGSIHTNYDLILRYDLHIIAEHELRAEHSLLASPEVSEDWDNNFTRFLLLARQPVSSQIPPQMAAKTSIVFVLENTPSALCKALACFSLRDIDLCKIESRPTSVKFLQTLQLRNKFPDMAPYDCAFAKPSANSQDLPRFSYTFYLELVATEFEERTQNALHHLKEQSQFVRILGSYPKSSQLIGHMKNFLDALSQIPIESELPVTQSAITLLKKDPLKIGIIGFGTFGQFLAKTFVKNNDVYCINKEDCSSIAKEIGCEFFQSFDIASFSEIDFDVILLSVSIISFEEVLRSLPKNMLRGKLIVDVLSVKVHARNVMLTQLPEDCDVLCTHPMFGPESGKHGWQGLPFLYDKIKIKDFKRCDRFLSLWEDERCKMIEMSCDLHDEYAANSQFITHLTGRILWEQNLKPTPIDTKGFQTVLNLVENTCKDSFDLFFGLYYYNKYAANQLQKIKEALTQVERQLAAKEAYLTATSEVNTDQSNIIVEECHSLKREVLQEAIIDPNGSSSTIDGKLPITLPDPLPLLTSIRKE